MDYVEIGHTLKAHGVRGEIKASIKEVYELDFDAADILFLKIRGQFIPYFVESIRSPNTPIIKFEDVTDRETAQKIASKSIFLKADAITEKVASTLTYGYCIGFELKDIYIGKVGTVKEILEYPQQEMAVIEYNGKETLIPLNPHFIKKIDTNSKHLLVELPEGLLEVGD